MREIFLCHPSILFIPYIGIPEHHRSDRQTGKISIGWIMKIKTILVVEDNELNMKLVRDLLKIAKYGYIRVSQQQNSL